MPEKTESRQRRWQKKQQAAGLCALCPEPASRWGLCKQHSEASVRRRRENRGVKKPYPDKQKWLQVDWSLPKKEIAAMMGVTMASVMYQMGKK